MPPQWRCRAEKCILEHSASKVTEIEQEESVSLQVGSSTQQGFCHFLVTVSRGAISSKAFELRGSCKSYLVWFSPSVSFQNNCAPKAPTLGNTSLESQPWYKVPQQIKKSIKQIRNAGPPTKVSGFVTPRATSLTLSCQRISQFRFGALQIFN